MIAVMASLGILGLAATTLAAVFMPFVAHASSPANRVESTPSSTIPPLIIIRCRFVRSSNSHSYRNRVSAHPSRRRHQ